MTKAEKDKLKHCPFCGDKPIYRIGNIHYTIGGWSNSVILECCIDMSFGFGKDGATEEEARIILYEQWNTRIKESQLKPQEGEREQILKPNHKCNPIAEAFMGKDRRLWIGELTEHIEKYPQEKYCLHIKTPVKDIVFLCNRGDFEQIYILAKVIGINPDKSWTESMVKGAKNNVTPPKG